MTDEKDKKINDLTQQITQLNNTISAKDKEIGDLNNKINQTNQQVTNLTTENTNKETQIKKLQTDLSDRDKTITDLNSKVGQLSEKQTTIDNLNKQLTEKTNSEKNKIEEISKLNENIKQKDEEIKKLNEQINQLKSEHENKIKQKEEELSKKDSKIKELEESIKNNEEIKKLSKINESLTLENEKLKKIMMPVESISTKKLHYDISLNFNSIKNIKEGWNLKFSENGLKYFNKSIRCPKIGILGNRQVGKSFILSRLFGSSFPQSFINSSEKISIKLKQKKNKIQFMIFDTQGFNNPILDIEKINDNMNLNNTNKNSEENEINSTSNINEQKVKEKNNKKSNLNDKEKKINLAKSEESIENLSNSCFNLSVEDLFEIKKNRNIEELITNKFLTEEFIASFMIDYSDILIIVVGLLNHSEQILLNKVMEECAKKNKKNLYVIHNLKNFFTKEQVNDYIKNILMNSATFNLEEKEEIVAFTLDDEDNKEENLEEEEDDSPHYYTSIYKSLTVNHLIFINDNCEEKSFNKFVEKKVETFFSNNPSTEFNIQEKFKSKIFELLNNYSKTEIKEENIIIEENKSEATTRKIIYKADENLKLRRYLKNEKSKTRSEFTPKYSYYTSSKEGKEKLYILIEAPGEITDEKINPRKTEDNKEYIIQYRGKKCLNEEELKQKDNIKIIGRDFGEFILDIPIPLKDYEILNLDVPKYFREKGIEVIEYELKNISNISIDLNYSESEEKKNIK